jgi:membrane-bound lytic murein transglycosylase F
MNSFMRVLLLIGLSAALSSCAPEEPPVKPWREELTVIVAKDDGSVDTEFRQQIVSLFAKELHTQVRLLPLPLEEITPALLAGRAHFAAAGMRSNDAGSLRFSPSYQSVSEEVVCGTPPKRLGDMVKKTIAVAAGSAQEAALREAQEKLPALHWDVRRDAGVSGLLAEVATGKLECTIANEEQLALAKNYYPRLDAAFDVAAPSNLAWAFASDSDEALYAEVKKFFTQIRKDGTLRHLLDRYYGHNERLEPIDSVAFITKAKTDLPRLKGIFEEASRLTGIEWQLLAAIGYHESHWNPLATSYTNVRGIMMLTEETADRMGVTDRLDPRQSILAGARYLLMLKEQLPLRIPDEERTWLALAAYNQGMGHLEDARVLAAKNGLNPDSWADVKKTMPWLAQPEYIEQARHGYARGGEAVILVETVHLYYDMLKHMENFDVPGVPKNPFSLKLPGVNNFTWP